MFSEAQVKSLSAPLARAHIKTRKQSGRPLSFVEGWHVIAEANRIFGFDGWTRETVELKCVTERERAIGDRKESGWGVTYIARVRVTVRASDLENIVSIIVREGCGAGHGIDRDLGLAHESAIKEAETDAMKRALMTFGNPFGLALYDKEQACVSDRDEAVARPLSKEASRSLDSQTVATEMISDLRKCKTLRTLKMWGDSPAIKEQIARLDDSDRERVRGDYAQQLNELKSKEAVAA